MTTIHKRRSFSSIGLPRSPEIRRSSISGERAKEVMHLKRDKSVKELRACYSGSSSKIEPEILFQKKIRASLPFAKYTPEEIRNIDSPKKLKFMNTWSSVVIFEDGEVSKEAATTFLAQYGITKDASNSQSWSEWEEVIETVRVTSEKKRKLKSGLRENTGLRFIENCPNATKIDEEFMTPMKEKRDSCSTIMSMAKTPLDNTLKKTEDCDGSIFLDQESEAKATVSPQTVGRHGATLPENQFSSLSSVSSLSNPSMPSTLSVTATIQQRHDKENSAPSTNCSLSSVTFVSDVIATTSEIKSTSSGILQFGESQTPVEHESTRILFNPAHCNSSGFDAQTFSLSELKAASDDAPVFISDLIQKKTGSALRPAFVKNNSGSTVSSLTESQLSIRSSESRSSASSSSSKSRGESLDSRPVSWNQSRNSSLKSNGDCTGRSSDPYIELGDLDRRIITFGETNLQFPIREGKEELEETEGTWNPIIQHRGGSPDGIKFRQVRVSPARRSAASDEGDLGDFSNIKPPKVASLDAAIDSGDRDEEFDYDRVAQSQLPPRRPSDLPPPIRAGTLEGVHYGSTGPCCCSFLSFHRRTRLSQRRSEGDESLGHYDRSGSGVWMTDHRALPSRIGGGINGANGNPNRKITNITASSSTDPRSVITATPSARRRSLNAGLSSSIEIGP